VTTERAGAANGATGHDEARDLTDDISIFDWSPKMRAVGAIVDHIADTDATVLVRGESGVGKDLVARAIHARSARRHGAFVRVNCAAIPFGLLESELFGHEKGAFTGATHRRLGRFERANQGTIYLDEIGDLPLELQAKLLHVLQDLRFSRVGGHAPVGVDARVIAATNRNLETAMSRLEFREDLYYRLNVVDLWVPPLRERREEISRLAAWFLDRFNAQYGRQKRLSPETLTLFGEHSWPGNVRELENTVRRMVVLSDGEQEFAALVASGGRRGRPDARPSPVSEGLREIARRAAREAERAALADVLERVRWNRLAASQILRVSYKTMLNKITEYRLTGQHVHARPSFVDPASIFPLSPPWTHDGSSPDAK
jgi:two-component system, NtrC family, response regulator AtoC